MSEGSQFLIPKEGLIVRDPVSKTPLGSQGEWKPWTGPEGRYWRRRVNCGDASIGAPPEEPTFYKKGGK